MKKLILSALALGATVCALASDDNSATVAVNLSIGNYAAITDYTSSVSFTTTGNPTGQTYSMPVGFTLLANCAWSISAAVTNQFSVGTLGVFNPTNWEGSASDSSQVGGFDIELSDLNLGSAAGGYTGATVVITLSGD
ncbi:MAG TPA: hypothetical protein VK934_05430 [Fimbriimonas sp.]|nr:hypothetical protein [Fimbriimonas sp.]